MCQTVTCGWGHHGGQHSYRGFPKCQKIVDDISYPFGNSNFMEAHHDILISDTSTPSLWCFSIVFVCFRERACGHICARGRGREIKIL